MADEKQTIKLADENIARIQEKTLDSAKMQREKQEEISEQILAATNGEVSGVPTAENDSEPTSKSKYVIKNLRTFQGDIAEAIKKQNASVLTIALAEKERKYRPVTLARNESDFRAAPPMSAYQKMQQTQVMPNTYYKAPSQPSIPQEVPAPAQSSPLFKPTPPAAPSVPRSVPAEAPVAQKPYVPAPMAVPARQPTQTRVSPEPSDHHTLIIATSLTLIVLGIGVMFGFYQFQKKGSGEVAQTQNASLSIVSFNKINTIDLDGVSKDQLVEKLNSVKNEVKLNTNDILHIALTKKNTEGGAVPITPAYFFSLLTNDTPPALLRAFGSDIMFGYFNDGANEPFLLATIDSFENTYSGMLDFEANMNKALGVLFSKRSLAISGAVEGSGSTTTTQVINFDLDSERKFEDDTIKNKDIRILKNDRGETILLYSFINKNTLLITSSEKVLEVMLTKLSNQNIVR